MAAGARSGADGADGRAAADAHAVVDGLLLFAGARTAHPRGCSRRSAFDLIFVHCSSVAQYVEDVAGVPKILDFGDMDSQKWLEYARYKPFPLSLGYRLEGTKMVARGEAARAPLRHLHGDHARRMGDARAAIGTGTPTDWFPERRRQPIISHRPAKPYDPRHHLRSSAAWTTTRTSNACSISAPTTCPLLQANAARAAADDRRRRPVAGDPAARRDSGVTVTGSVPDVRPYLRRSALMVAPLNIARGTQNKILEAMALGVPVVASEIAAGGVDVFSGQHLLTARTPGEYRSAILHILEDPRERARLSGAARARMLSHHSWSRSMQRLDEIIERCIGRHAANQSSRNLSTKTWSGSAARLGGGATTTKN